MEVNNDCNNQRLRGKTMDFDQELDARGINCPLPIIRARKSIESMDNGQLLRIVATDPGSVKDFQAFCEQTKNELVEHKEEGGEYLFLIRKTA
jgi:tRNA 2-thiouridine synthesizing protein A